MRELNAAGLTLIKKWEGIMDGDPSTVNLDPYLDPVGIWTIGWGHAIVDARGKFLRGLKAKDQARALYPNGLTLQQAEDLLRADCLEACKDVSSLIKVSLMDNQFAALVSFEFNTGALGRSSMLRLLNRQNFDAAGKQFSFWTRGRTPEGKLVVLPGLVSRRAEEQELFERKENV